MGGIQGNALTIYICFMLICILTFLALSDGGGMQIDTPFFNIVHCLGKNDNKSFLNYKNATIFMIFIHILDNWINNPKVVQK